MKAESQNWRSNIVSLSSSHWQLLKTHRLPGSSSDSHTTNTTTTTNSHANNKALPRSRQRHSATRVGDFVYVFGGKDGTSALKDIWKYHIYDQTWEIVKLRGGSLPLLQGHTAVTYRRLIVIFGGTFNNNVNDIQMWIFNTDLGHLREVWGEAGAVQPLCRRDHSAVMHHNLMYVFGGFKDPTGASHELWVFNLDEEEWTEVTQLSHSRPGGRYGHSAVVWDNTMWVYGGSTGLTSCCDFWKYSFSLHQWTKLKYVGNPPAVSGHSACVLRQQMVVVGGNCKGRPVNDVWIYRFDISNWTKVTTAGMPLPGLSSHCSLTVSAPDPWTFPSTDRALSTPHLKPPPSSSTSSSTPLLHPDRFLVRPRTSPSVLEDPGPGSCQEVEGRTWGADSTAVMRMEGLNSEGSTSVTQLHHNSSNRADPRIHVSLREPLVPDSPAQVGFYDSCIPFSPRGPLEHREEEVQVIHGHSVAGGGGGCASLQCTTLAHANHCSSSSQGSCPLDTTTEYLADQSQSPVLRASKHGYKTAVVREITFWNDMFIEDLESSDEVGLSEVKISYPPKHPLLPLSTPVVDVDCDGVETVQDNSPHEWKADTSPHQRKVEHSDQQQNSHCVHLSQQQHDGHGTERVRTDMGLTQPAELTSPPPQVQQASRPSPHSSAGDHDPDVTIKVPDDIHKNKANVLLEQETSFIDGGDCVGSLLVPVQVGSREAATVRHFNTARSENTASRPAAAAGVARCGRTAGCAERPMNCIAGPGAGGVKEEMLLEDPFVLVLGGKTEEQITSIMPKPIAVWKGTFV